LLTSGKWLSPYDGKSYTKDSALDIDHLVPLAEAWRSGAWAWSALQRQNYANDLTEPKALVAVSLGLNRQKGDRDPSSWLPPLDKCGYMANRITVKYKNSLTVDSIEAETLSISITKCAIVNVVIGEASPISSETPTASSTPATIASPVPIPTSAPTPLPR